MHHGFTQTTIRLPSKLHLQLKMAAAAHKTSMEDLVASAVRRELARLELERRRAVKVPSTMNPLLAELFLQSMPTFAVIKDRRAKIVWVNFYFEKALETPLSSIVGSTITRAGLIGGIQKDTIDANIKATLKDRQPRMSVEGMVLKGLGPVTVRAQRYMFGDGMMGDISFVENYIKDRRFTIDMDAAIRMENVIPDPAVEELFVPFLEAAPVSIAIKRPIRGDSIIIWANEQYLKLAHATSIRDVVGRQTRQVFGLGADHPILKNEEEIMQTGKARMAKERLPDRGQRWSMRFPIAGRDGKVGLLGVVSPDFLQNDAATRLL